ncbi:MHYT domain-containing protein [Streptomyces indicus]|uniref:MHYT domain-containing protein, NO-binding membrane sensor n=1 Tax=Streptomyces indicus TaxID=417292 RepID=A0A1G9GZG8_9ACTN|nr:MHYT domain-containing protein [Streptomyces indicus]SDL05962.1 MHYT domain-containing protein, NO-binding membrane sensor [Streptomyces indicus]
MDGTIDGFSYGWVTPVVGYVMACFGSALGLRCTTRSLFDARTWRPGWLLLGAGAIGCGIWTMHFIAMIGFTVREARVAYDWPLTYGSLAVAIVVVSVGVFIVGYLGATVPALLTGGVITGLGVAGMHYMGMAAMTVRGGSLGYDAGTVAVSLVIAIVAATAALWCAVQVRGLLWSLGASLIMGVAVTGMHYTGMAAVHVHLHGAVGSGTTGTSPFGMLVPMLIGPLAFLVVAGAVVMFDPMMIMGESGRGAAPQRLEVDVPSLVDRDRLAGSGPFGDGARPVGGQFDAFAPAQRAAEQKPLRR